jgi:type IV pilus assembly protein PilE
MAKFQGRAVGLTLIELMVVVAVLAILATIAIPAYDRLMTSVRRSDGRGALTSVALAQERYFSVYQHYTPAMSTLISLAGLDSEFKYGNNDFRSIKRNYLLSVAATSTTFLVTAAPDPSKPQANDTYCTEMTIDGTGKKSGKPATDNKCW